MEAAGINRRIQFEPTAQFIQRFWDRVEKRSADECWEWRAAFRNNYGAIKHQGKVLSAHRVAYILTHGEPDLGFVIAHKCDNRACCNPHHLEAVTPGTNNRDARGRLTFHMARGEQSPTSVLTEKLVREICRLRIESGYGARKIARLLDLNQHTVKSVLAGRTWNHIADSILGEQRSDGQ